jgi:lipopolysaccharide transport system ATP-binding protein
MGYRSHSLQSFLGDKLGGFVAGEKRNSSLSVCALRNISLSIANGDRVGVLGHNGAGKTSLLRLITGVYPPSDGFLKVDGVISSLTDFTLGMEPDATGLKNIIFRLIFMGYSYKEANAAIDSIVDFSGLGEFVNLPVRTYSTGMYMRLAFSISTHFSPDILVLDEVIGAGDEAFREKAKTRLNSLLENSRIVILSSHDLGAIKLYCDKALILEKGNLKFFGPVNEAVDIYLDVLEK